MAGLISRLLRKKRTIEVSLPREVTEAAADHLLHMDEALERLAQLPGIEEFQTTRRLPSDFFVHWRAALDAYDRYLETMTSTPALQVRCGRGCVACCHDVPTGVQAVEMLAIYASMRAFPDWVDVHNRLCDLGEQVYRLLRERAPEARAVASDSEVYQSAQHEFRRRRLACAFLGADGSCRIYAWRPIPCRMHFATTDPAWCWGDHAESNKAVTPNLEPPSDMLAHMKTIAARLGLQGLSPSLFQGLATLGNEVLAGRRLEAPTSTHSPPHDRPQTSTLESRGGANRPRKGQKDGGDRHSDGGAGR